MSLSHNASGATERFHGSRLGPRARTRAETSCEQRRSGGSRPATSAERRAVSVMELHCAAMIAKQRAGICAEAGRPRGCVVADESYLELDTVRRNVSVATIEQK